MTSGQKRENVALNVARTKDLHSGVNSLTHRENWDHKRKLNTKVSAL